MKENLNKGKSIKKWTSLNIEINKDDIEKPIGDMPYLWDLPGLIMISEKAEVSQTFHQKNKGCIHINPNTIPSGINRKTFNSWRRSYWRNRANDFKL